MIRLDDQVAIITGSGRGLGAAYAHLLAARGARVVIHDAGVNKDGTGFGKEKAQVRRFTRWTLTGSLLYRTRELRPTRSKGTD